VLLAIPRIAGTEYVFTSGGSAPISGYSKYKMRLDAIALALAKADAISLGEDSDRVSLAPWRLHDLRRTATSGMARAKVPVHVIEAVLNHLSGSISGVTAVYNRYRYLDEKREALQEWGRLVADDNRLERTT
jgi:integrase